MSTIATSGRVRSTSSSSASASAAKPDDLEARLVQQAGQTFAQDHGVVGEGYAHGISARSVVPRPGGLETVKPAAERLDAVGEPAQPRAAGGRWRRRCRRRRPPRSASAPSHEPTHADLAARASAWRRWSAPR